MFFLDDTPKQFTKIETEKTIRREFEGETIVKESEKTIRCETSHSSTGVTAHKERTETVVQKSSIQGKLVSYHYLENEY